MSSYIYTTSVYQVFPLRNFCCLITFQGWVQSPSLTLNDRRWPSKTKLNVPCNAGKLSQKNYRQHWENMTKACFGVGSSHFILILPKENFFMNSCSNQASVVGFEANRNCKSELLLNFLWYYFLSCRATIKNSYSLRIFQVFENRLRLMPPISRACDLFV